MLTSPEFDLTDIEILHRPDDLAADLFEPTRVASATLAQHTARHDARPFTGAGRFVFVCPCRLIDLYFPHSSHLSSEII